MKRDELRKLLGEDASDDVIDKIMADYGKGVNAAKAGEDTLRERLEALSAKNEELEKAANANLTDTQKMQKQVDAANKAAADARMQLNRMTAVAVFAGSGMSEDDYEPFLGSITGGTREEAEAAAKGIAAVVDRRVKAATDEASKQSLGSMKQPAGGDPADSVVTKADFDGLTQEQQIQWVRDNPNKLSSLQ
ncbi:hypothetical protein [Collinsella bouchesdurhonensis]|uniref:hypothetical protein n=1 Tax=Collinsella bouchesdurhonensis TaxID=1907654 RepID=UPI001105FF08|nr:hypothetical protein [Collinsella bouchesdurhonensis]